MTSFQKLTTRHKLSREQQQPLDFDVSLLQRITTAMGFRRKSGPDSFFGARTAARRVAGFNILLKASLPVAWSSMTVRDSENLNH